MFEVIKQRKYIQDFMDFTHSFLLTEQATVDELNLVKSNLEILNDRIKEFGSTVKIGYEGMVSREDVENFIDQITQ